jgi:cardiolipin synthase
MFWRNKKTVDGEEAQQHEGGGESVAEERKSGNEKRRKRNRWIATFVFVMHVLGVWTSIEAVMSTRTSQGAIAWAVSLNTFPYVAVPAYWIFGQSKFDGYDLLRLNQQLRESETVVAARQKLEAEGLLVSADTPVETGYIQLLDNLTKLPMTTGNSVDLLIDGEATFSAILDAIDQAEEYVLFQFYILRDDEIGRRCLEALRKKISDGVRVYVLYDELGSKDFSESYLRELRGSGMEIVPFNTTQGRGNRFRLNFRNHRKIVVVDGDVAFVGGLNVGDEYLGKDPVLSPWRDTHVRVRGPVVHCIQAPFVEDWNWATGAIPELDWKPAEATGGTIAAACLPTGPADTLETGTLFFLHAINSAKRRLWIVSPYFVPDEQVMSALQLAALRGVDVRVLIPQNPDHLHVYLSGLSYLVEAKQAGVKIYRYQPGFLHQKVWLIDDHTSFVGTANLDNRSMRLNFEITLMMIDEGFASEVEAMLEEDFRRSELASPSEYTERSLPYRFLVRVCRLFAPVQ